MERSETRMKRHWRLYWQLTPEEKQWLRGTGNVTTARTAGLFFAVFIGGAVAALAMESLFRDHNMSAYWGLAEGMAFVVLGNLMHRGERWASLSLMALYTLDPTATHLIGHMRGYTYPAEILGLWRFGTLAAWACVMRVFWLAYRLERRAATATLAGQ
jgi:hypothetical protein